MRKAKEKNKPLLSLAAAGLAALLLFGMATAVLAQGTQGKFVADEWSGIAEADIAEGDSTKDQAENQASTTPTPTPVSTQDESTALSDATPESAESSELTENKETDSDSNAEIPAEVSAFSNDLAVEEVSLYDASGTSAQDAVTSWTELKSAVASAANGATIYLSGEITIPLDEVLSVSKNLRLVGTGSAQYTNTVGVGSETVAQGYTYTQNASLRMGDASGVQTDHDNVMIYISGGTTLEIENVFLNGNNNCENVVYTEGTGSKISLQNCTVGYGNDNGILLNPGQAEINGSLVFNNGEYAGDGTALYRFENGSAVLSGNVRSQGLGGGGLTCAAGSHVQAAASSFVWNKTSGFDIPEADSSASAENCFFWGNGWTGANVRSNSVMTLTGCQVENNGYNTANLLTTDGDTASNTFPGLDVQGAGTMKISHCGILNNAGNGVQCYPDSKTYLYGWNHIYANGINGVYTQGQLWIGKAADSANGDETTAVYNNAADGVHTDGGTVQGDHLNCYGNSYSGISAMKNESLDQTATLELTAPVTSHENGHSGLYLKGGTKATVSGGSFTENGAEHAEIYAGSGTDTTLKDGVEVKTSADKTLQNSGLRIAVMLDGVDVFRTDSTLQIPAGDSIHLEQDADVITWNGGTRSQLGVTCENPWLGRTIIRSDVAVLDWENSRESNSAQTAEQHPENGIDTNLYYTAIEDAYFGMKNSDAHDVWLSYKSNYQYYYNHDAAAGTALTADGIDSGELLGTVRKFYGITADVTAPTDVDDTAPYYICSANAGHSAAVQTHRFADWLLNAQTYADGVTTLAGGAALQDITINDDGGSILGSYGNHKTVTAEPAVLSYYAGWQAAMTYDLDGGTLNGAQNGFAETKHNGQGYTVQAEPQKEGYRFLGWKATQSWNGETALTDGLLAAGSSYTNDYDTTFTAQWKRNTFTLTAIAVNGTPDIGQAVSDNITSESNGTTQTKTESEVPLGESRAVTYAPLASGNYLLSGIYLDEDTVDWNDQKYAEIWRQGWADTANRYLEAIGSPERLDLRSYVRQGIDKIPTVHMGPAVSQLEKKGIQTNIGNLNRDIKAANSLMQSIRQMVRSLKGWLSGLKEKKAALLEALEQAKEPTIPELLSRYLDKRSEERTGWTSKGKLKGTVGDFNKVMEALDFLRQKEISTVESLDAYLDEASAQAVSIREEIRPMEKRVKEIDRLLFHIGNFEANKPVHAKYAAIRWKKPKEKFAADHKEELDAYNAALRYFKVHLDGAKYSTKKLAGEQAQLSENIASKTEALTAVQEDVKILRDVRHWLNQVLPSEQYRQTAEPGKKPSIQQAVKGREQRIREEQAEKHQQPRRQQKQDMEL